MNACSYYFPYLQILRVFEIKVQLLEIYVQATLFGFFVVKEHFISLRFYNIFKQQVETWQVVKSGLLNNTIVRVTCFFVKRKNLILVTPMQPKWTQLVGNLTHEFGHQLDVLFCVLFKVKCPDHVGDKFIFNHLFIECMEHTKNSFNCFNANITWFII